MERQFTARVLADATHTGFLTASHWTLFNSKEAPIGNPATTGFILSSTDAGVRSWVARPANESGAANNFLTAYNSATGAWTKAQPAWSNIDKTTSSLADITTRSHTALTDIGTNTHTNIDSHISGNGTAVHGLGTISTQAASSVAITGGTLAGLTGLAIRDTSAAFDVTLAAVSSTALTAGRTLIIDLVNAGRTLKMTGNAVLNQDVSSTGAPTFATINVSAYAASPALATLRANGTPSSPTATANNDVIGLFYSGGRGTTGWGYAAAGLFGFYAAENFTDTAQGTYFVIGTTPKSAGSGGHRVEALRITSEQNVGIGTTTFGTSATKTGGFGTGVAPTTSPADMFQMYSADIAPGNAAAHFRTEGGAVIKLYQQAHVVDPTGGATVDAESRTAINAILVTLENLGLHATA